MAPRRLPHRLTYDFVHPLCMSNERRAYLSGRQLAAIEDVVKAAGGHRGSAFKSDMEIYPYFASMLAINTRHAFRVLYGEHYGPLMRDPECKALWELVPPYCLPERLEGWDINFFWRGYYARKWPV
jgi:hypothetical protein